MKSKILILILLFIAQINYLAIAQDGVQLEPSTTVTIEAGTKMVMTTGDLLLKSNASGDASMIVKGEVILNNSGETKAQRYLPGIAQTWHMIGAPVNMAINGSVFAPDASDDFYAWDEPTPGTWINYKGGNFSGVNGGGKDFLAAKGYLIAYDAANPTKTFSGDLNTGDKTFNLKNSGSKTWTYESGWNLMSNPYSSSIDWNKADRTQFQDHTAYVYDVNKSGGEGYVYINGANANAFIGSNQGFFVIAKTTANNQDFTFTNALQTHGGSFLKSTDADNTLILRLSSQNYYDETTITLTDESSLSRDRKDALKLYSFNSSVPQLYSISEDDINLAVNSIPQMNAETPIPLNVRIPKDESYTISIQNNSSDFASNILYLEDKTLNKLHKLSDEDYQFTAAQGDIDNRFVLHFGMTGIDVNDEADLLNIWAYKNELNIISDTKQAQLEIFDMQGRLISSKKISINGKYSEMLYLLPGVYIVRLQNRKMVESRQILVE